ncbi:hypothetical protein Taro_037414 [Colocasia esculenta]|uniref:Transposase MuDR plant domain-containing protein n=1 Tax=Colocasia esculenta TaxID=4460 RepID=A0A843W441_COLES|nr:hypothetical protein [Colocasia esculenta]
MGRLQERRRRRWNTSATRASSEHRRFEGITRAMRRGQDEKKRARRGKEESRTDGRENIETGSSRYLPFPAVCVGRKDAETGRLLREGSLRAEGKLCWPRRGFAEGALIMKLGSPRLLHEGGKIAKVRRAQRGGCVRREGGSPRGRRLRSCGVRRGEIAKGVAAEGRSRRGVHREGGSPRRGRGFRREGEGGSLRRGFLVFLAARFRHHLCEGGSLRFCLSEITQIVNQGGIEEIRLSTLVEIFILQFFDIYVPCIDMNRVPEIFIYKNEAYVIPIHRDMKFSGILDDVCTRWTLMKDQMELKCRIPDMGNSVMKLLNGGDIDRIIDMHEIIGSKMINIKVHVFGSEEVLSIRASAEQSSVNNNIRSIISGISSQEMRLRSDLWHDVIHSTGQIFVSVEHLRNDLTKYVISRGFDFTFIKNDSTRVTVHCKIATCAWSLHANRIGLGPQFKIKSLNNVHSCGGGLSTQKHPRASKKWVSTIVQEKIVDAPLYRPKDIKKDIFREYGVDLPSEAAGSSWRRRAAEPGSSQGLRLCKVGRGRDGCWCVQGLLRWPMGAGRWLVRWKRGGVCVLCAGAACGKEGSGDGAVGPGGEVAGCWAPGVMEGWLGEQGHWRGGWAQRAPGGADLGVELWQ